MKRNWIIKAIIPGAGRDFFATGFQVDTKQGDLLIELEVEAVTIAEACACANSFSDKGSTAFVYSATTRKPR